MSTSLLILSFTPINPVCFSILLQVYDLYKLYEMSCAFMKYRALL